MGSRPSTTHAGTNGTLTNQTEAALRTENDQLKKKLNAFEQLEPDKLKQENDELKKRNEKLQTQLENLRESSFSKSTTDSSEHLNNPEHDKKVKNRSTRRINSNLTSQRLSDIDAYGQGIPLEKHPIITIRSRRSKQHKKKDANNGDPDELNTRSLAVETSNGQSHAMSKVNDQGQREPTDSSSPGREEDPDAMAGNNVEQQIAIDSGRSLTGSTTPCLSVNDDVDDDGEKSCQESDLLS